MRGRPEEPQKNLLTVRRVLAVPNRFVGNLYRRQWRTTRTPENTKTTRSTLFISIRESMAAFYPFRSVGVYTDEFPFALQRLGSTNFVTVPIEKSFQVFNVRFQFFHWSRYLSLNSLCPCEISRGRVFSPCPCPRLIYFFFLFKHCV